jgi:predicted acyl esterase
MPVSSSTHVDLGPSHGVRMSRASVPMRDGVHLNVSAYTPRAGGKVPAVVELTPYTVDSAHGEGQYFPGRGLAYVVADVRGRGDSEGVFRQMINDAPDACDLIDWVIQQPWSDGRVVLYGGSYSGMNQWLILGQRHPAVVAASPAAAPMIGLELPRGGIPNAYDFKWRAMIFGKALYTMSGTDGGLWAQEIRAAMDEGRPFWTAAEAFGVPYDDELRAFLETPGLEHWPQMRPTDDQLAGLDVPVLTVTGTHDACMPGTIEHWLRFIARSADSALQRSHLVIGPWDHAGTDSGHNVVADLSFGEEARLPMRQMRTDWFRHILFGEPNPPLLSDRFVYYIAGSETWRSAPSIEVATVGAHPLYLKSAPGPNDVFHSGWLLDAPADGPDYEVTMDPSDSKTVDLESIPRPGAAPDNPLFAMAYTSLLMTFAGEDPTNQIFPLAVDGDGVIYHSPALPEPMTVVGQPALRLALILDQPDVDLCVYLHEIRPDGQSIFVSSDLARASRSNSQGTLRGGELAIIDISDMRFCSRTVGAGSRLRLTVRSAWSSLTLPSGDGRYDHPPVTVRIVHRADTPATLTLPLGSLSS